MALGRFLFNAEDPELQHIALSLETGSDEHAKRHCRYLDVDMATLRILSKLAGIHLQGLLPRGTAITLKTTSAPRDDRNRILAGVFAGDACINRLYGYAISP